MVLSSRIYSIGEARLGFDLIASSHFHVFEYMEEDGQCMGVDIYSSKTTTWIFKESKWGEEAEWTFSKSIIVFLNGCLHYIGFCDGYRHILAVDMEGKTWRKIPNWTRGFSLAFLQNQGHLCQCTVGVRNMSKLSI